MTLFEANTQVFIVRIWLEPRDIENATAEWRGVIEHLPTGERRYVKDLGELQAFMATYLEGMRVELGLRSRMRRWLNQWKSQNRQ
jgi:hypothetical protein